MKIFNNISKEKAQRILFITVLILVFGVFFISLSLLSPGRDKDPDDNPPPNHQDGDRDGDKDGDKDKDKDGEIITYEELKVPYSSNGEIQVIRKFWSLDLSTEDQEMSLINYGSEYYLSKGISYTTEEDEEFQVIACLSGTVVDIQDSQIYGKTVTIEHTNGIKTEYQSLGSVSLNVDDVVTQGDIIGTSGENEYDVDAGNHIHFKLSINNKYVDPTSLFGKPTNKITG